MSKYAKAPFPYYGGKSRIADLVWEAFGRVDRYIEPFFGSGAVLLRNPRQPKSEIIGDMSPHVANFWRSIKAAPDEVAFHADFPTSHMDLHARHGWLMKWADEKHDELWSNPEFFDAQAAGWWAWGMSLWIGGGFAEAPREKIPFTSRISHSGQGVQAGEAQFDKIPLTRGNSHGGQGTQASPPNDIRPMVNPHSASGTGISMQAGKPVDEEPHDIRPHVKGTHHSGTGSSQQAEPPHDGRPHVKGHHHRGQGVAVQAQPPHDKIPWATGVAHGERGTQANAPNDIRPNVNMHDHSGSALSQQANAPNDIRPHVSWKDLGGQAVAQQTQAHQDEGPMPLDGTRLLPWMRWLAERIRKVTILHRPWESCVTDVMTMKAATNKPIVGIFLDPPYRTQGNRSEGLYRSDIDGTSDDTAVACYEWAVAAAKARPELRIAYCCRHGDFPLPDGWTEDIRTFAGHNKADRREKDKDQIMFSPACFPNAVKQGGLFGDGE